MDIAEFTAWQVAAIIQRFTEDIQQTSQALGRHRDMERGSGIINSHAPVQAGTSVQGDGAHMAFIKVLMDLEQVGLVIKVGAQGLLQGW